MTNQDPILGGLYPEADQEAATAKKENGTRSMPPRTGGGKQQSFKLSGRITRHVADRSKRHEVSNAETVRSMLNAQIDHEEMIRSCYQIVVAESYNSQFNREG